MLQESLGKDNHLNGIQEVGGSIPPGSTNEFKIVIHLFSYRDSNDRADSSSADSSSQVRG